MNTQDLGGAPATLFAELLDGSTPRGGYMLNPNDPGLLASLDRLDAGAASSLVSGGSSIAAHVDHLRYGLSLMNHWAAGENPWGSADWKASWNLTTVSEDEWAARRSALRSEAHRWLETLRTPRDVDERGLTGILGSIAHLAYHMGAIRQMATGAKGPNAND